MNRKSLLLALIFVPLIVARSLASDSAPPWMQTAAQQTVPHLDKDVSAIVLYNEETVLFNDKGQLIRHGRRAIKVLTKEGKEHAHKVVPYNIDSKVNDFAGWHIPPDGKVRKADKKDIADTG